MSEKGEIGLKATKKNETLWGVRIFHSSIEFGGVPCQLDQSVLYPTYKSVLGSPARRISGGSGVLGKRIVFFSLKTLLNCHRKNSVKTTTWKLL